MARETKSSSLGIVAIVALIAILAGAALFFLSSGGLTEAPAQDISIDVEAPEVPDVEVDLPELELPTAE